MAVIFGGGELSSFVKFNAIETTTAGTFSLPARCGIHVKKNGYIRTDTQALLNELWIHFDINIGKVTSGLNPIVVVNNSGQPLLTISSDGKVNIGAGQVGTVPFMTAGRFTIDLNLRGGTNGLVEIYTDSQIVFSANGNFNFSNMQSLLLSPVGYDTTPDTLTVYSQVIIANEKTIGSKLATLNLDAVGSNNAWLGNANTAVNEIALDDTTYISAPTAGLVETWTTSDLSAEYTNVRAVIVSALGKNNSTGPKNLDAATRVAGNNYFVPMSPLGSGYTPSQAVFNTNPVTNASWTRDEVNASEFGIRSKV